MDLSPNDIRNYEFDTQMRGYDKEEVDSLLDQLATAWEDAKQDNLKLSMEIDSLKAQISSLKQFEDTIKKAAIDARRSADETVAKANEEAHKILADANREAAELVGSKVHEVKHFETQLEDLEQTKRSFITGLRQLIVSHQDQIDEIASAEVKKELSEDNDSNGFEVTASTDVTRESIETLANEEASDSYDESNDSGEIPTREQEEAPVDQELAQALNSYHMDNSKEQPSQASPVSQSVVPALQSVASAPQSVAPVPQPVAPAPGEFVETDKAADEVPEEFIPVGEVPPVDQNSDTDRVAVSTEPAVAEDIAAELDSVVAKFEEEMDKAEKS